MIGGTPVTTPINGVDKEGMIFPSTVHPQTDTPAKVPLGAKVEDGIIIIGAN